REPADQLLLTCDEPDMRSAEARRQAQLLTLSDRDVGPVLAWRREHGEADRVDARDGQRARGMGSLREPARIHQQSEEVRLLKDERRRLARRLLAAPNLHAPALTEGAQDLQVLGVQVARDQDLVATGMD